MKFGELQRKSKQAKERKKKTHEPNEQQNWVLQ